MSNEGQVSLTCVLVLEFDAANCYLFMMCGICVDVCGRSCVVVIDTLSPQHD